MRLTSRTTSRAIFPEHQFQKVHTQSRRPARLSSRHKTRSTWVALPWACCLWPLLPSRGAICTLVLGSLPGRGFSHSLRPPLCLCFLGTISMRSTKRCRRVYCRFSLRPSFRRGCVCNTRCPFIQPCRGSCCLFSQRRFTRPCSWKALPRSQPLHWHTSTMPLLVFAFNWPLYGLLWQLTGPEFWWVLIGGLLYAGSKLAYTCSRASFIDANTVETAYAATHKAYCRSVGVLVLSYIVFIVGFLLFASGRDRRDRDPPFGFWDIVVFTCEYYTSFYVSWVAATDLLLRSYVRSLKTRQARAERHGGARQGNRGW